MPTRRTTLASLAGLALAPAPLRAQAPPGPSPAAESEYTRVSRTLYGQGLYLPLYRAALASQDSLLRSSRDQWAALVGDEVNALSRAAPTSEAAPDLGGAVAEDAISAIVKAAAGRRVIILNEAHVASRHRMFLSQLLRALRREGFTHLAAETFNNQDLAAATKVERLTAEDQLSFAHGTYITDPVFAEAVREALASGYRLAAYEQRPDQSHGETGEAGVGRREQSEAENFAAVLERWPQARFLVYVGYAHLLKTPVGKNGQLWFAARLRKLTGIEPLTITQANNGSFGPHAADGRAAQAVLDRFRPTRPIVVRAKAGAMPGDYNFGADLAVFHPSLPDVAGRPGWLAADRNRRRARLRLPVAATSEPMLCQAIHAADLDPAIPADQYLVPLGARDLTFFLRPGRYRVRLETPDGHTPLDEIRV